jgi:hypothetical protein
MLSKKSIIIGFILLLVVAELCDCKRRKSTKLRSKYSKQKVQHKLYRQKSQKQLFYESRETNPPNFIRLVLMRLIYGIATNMGMEDRLDGVLGGAFAPPNTEGDFFDFGLGGGDDDGFDFGL